MKKVAIIDDEPRLAHMLAELLEGEGYEAFPLTDPKGATELVTGWQPDAIILDILMPQISGWEVLKDLKANRMTSHIPVIVHSASPRECQNILELSRYDDVSVLPKPWDVDDLLAKVERAIVTAPAG